MRENGHLSLIEGNLWKAMLKFSIPLLLINLCQAIYSVVDMIIVGQFAGAAGLTAVGNGSQITMIVLTIVMGLANGSAVIVAQLAGAGKKKEITDTVGTMILAFVIVGAVLTVVLFVLTKPILTLLHTPAEAFEQTVWYLRICLIGTVFVYLYNIMAALLRGLGNTTIPLIAVALTMVINLILDFLFVGPLGFGAAGAAAATLIAQVICAVCMFRPTWKNYPILQVGRGDLKIQRHALHNLLKIGMPQSIQFTLTNISFAFILGLVNDYGNTASAVSVSVTRLSTFAVLSGQALMGAIIAMAGQNIGAKQYGRARKGMLIGMIYALPLAFVFFVLSEVSPQMMLGLFTTDAGVLSMGAPYLKVMAISFLVETVMFCMFGLMTGAGYTNITMCCALITAFLVRYPLARLFSVTLGWGFAGIAWAYPFAPMVSCVICILFILSGRWKVSRFKG